MSAGREFVDGGSMLDGDRGFRVSACEHNLHGLYQGNTCTERCATFIAFSNFAVVHFLITVHHRSPTRHRPPVDQQKLSMSSPRCSASVLAGKRH